MGASSNFGNMLSMALASIALPFLPMLPTQILLNNLLYDFSEVGIPFDDVREEATARPQLWDMGGLIRFAAIMGPLSSLFDILTFAMLALVFHAAPAEFRTAWFLESMATQILVIFIIRTNGRPWRDRPSRALASSSLIALGVAMVLPFTPASVWFGFETPAAVALVGVGVIVVLYLLSAELLKPLAFKSGRDHATIWRRRSAQDVEPVTGEREVRRTDDAGSGARRCASMAETASRRLIRSRRSDPTFAERTGRTSPPAAQSRRPSCSD